MEQYLTDTNAVSDYFSGSFDAAGMTFMDEVMDARPNISIITQIELLCWNTDTTTTENIKIYIEND